AAVARPGIRILKRLVAKALSSGRESTEVAPSADAERQTLTKLVEDLQHRLSAETRRRSRPDERIASLEAKLTDEGALRAAAQTQAQALREELAALEAALAETARAGGAEADKAIELRGLALLYVRGRGDHVARMRAAAERCSATFSHH